MDRHTIEILEYEKVLGLLARYASSEMGIDRVLRLAPLEAISEIEARATMISEIKYLLEWGKSPPLSGIRDIRNTISRAKIPGTVLDAKALLATNSVVRSSRLTRAFFCENKERGGRLWGLASGLRELPDLEKAIDAAIDEDTNIRDEASPVLKRIRREKARISGRVASTLSGLLARESVQPYLQESIITIRNGRYVVPVRAEAKARLAGIVHDTSHSGATVFIEPMETVELNNALRSLELEEKDEIVKILSGLTDRVREGAGEISIDLEILAELDLIQAAARFSREFGCSRPEINPERRTVIKGGRHPILVEIVNRW
jgi:DNA mismatch repair protein MutS2